ncbi:uncharacterized protein LOC129578882 isoform X2 [Sitodiplosis mosellana]|nr:uncharacterized protein LOC129578882 isoform X2 [Sitodiplosis mosellana]XP_055324091.1 uncharacterized protein LOC129578882 isoform X2 [Sitodiplosis mosellana]XP_055324092.1 uncharacterized protein LOC129578882 isoform X2 [Sitodiplosis mosellana]
MTKTMDSFLDAHNNTAIQNSMIGFDELMTPIIDPELGMKDHISTWIDSSHDHLNISKDDDFAFDESAIALPTIFNSPPNSVQSFSSNDDADCSANIFLNNSDDMIETEKSFDFVDERLQQPMKNSQDYLYAGPMAFHREIETLAYEQNYNSTSNGYFDDNEDDMIMEEVTPIVGNDLMFSERQIPQMAIKDEIRNNDTYDINMNEKPVHKARANLLARRTLNQPQIHLKIKMGTVLPNGNNNYIIEEPVPINNTTTPAVISTPQLINEILEKECEGKFDLINFIDADNEIPQTVEMVEINTSKENVEEQVSIAKIEQILPTPVASPQNKHHTECNDEVDDEIETKPTPIPVRAVRATKRRAATRTLDFSEVQPKRSRGRPPKTEPTILSPSEIKRLSSADLKYYQMRIKNNEASRRSRLNRKGKEEALFDEHQELEERNTQLTIQDLEIDRQIQKWTKRVMKLAVV